MATVSGCSLALLDAGVDLPGGPVAGVSVGMAPNRDGERLLLDITGTEVRDERGESPGFFVMLVACLIADLALFQPSTQDHYGAMVCRDSAHFIY